MKQKLLLTALLVVTIFSITKAQVPTYVPTSGLQAWYPFSGNANDLSGNGNNGTVNGAILAKDRFGNSNKAYNFILNTDKITIPLAQTNLTGYTVSGWFIKPYGTGGTFFVGSNFSTLTHGLLLSMGNDYQIGFGAEYGTNSVWTYCNGTNFVDSNWHFFCAVYNASNGNVIDSTNLTLIIDTVVLIKDQKVWGNQLNVTSPIDNNGNNTVIGNYTYNPFGSFRGILDDIGIWNRALTQQEITALYSFKPCPKYNVNITSMGGTTICAGSNVVLNANSVSGYNYQWYNNTSLLTGQTGIIYNANQTGLYKLIIDSSGCHDTSNVISITVNPIPTVSFTIPTITNYTGTNINLTGLPTGGVYNGAGVIGSIFQPNVAGLGNKTITYTYTNANGCTNSATQQTLVYDTVICSQTIHIYDTITTHIQDTITTHISINDTIPVYDSIHYAIYDTLTIQLYDTITTHITINDTITHYLAVTDTLLINAVLTGVPGPNNTNLIKVFPNPASDHLIINYGNYASMSGYSVKVTNALAQTVYSSVIIQQQVSIDLSTWSGKGTYILSIMNGSGAVIETRKIILQ